MNTLHNFPPDPVDDAALDQFEAELCAALWRFDCPPPDQLRELAVQSLSLVEAATLQQHVQICPHCRLEVAELQQLLAAEATLYEEPAVQPPTSLGATLNTAVHFFRQSAAQLTGEIAAQGRLLVATLLTNLTPLAPAGVALRGAANDATRTYECAIGLVSMGIQPVNEQEYAVDGQLLLLEAGSPAGHYRLTGRGAAGPVSTGELDELGCFRLNAIPGGEYQLALHLAGTTILLPNIVI